MKKLPKMRSLNMVQQTPIGGLFELNHNIQVAFRVEVSAQNRTKQGKFTHLPALAKAEDIFLRNGFYKCHLESNSSVISSFIIHR